MFLEEEGENFPPLPLSIEGTPCKEPAHKKALLATPEKGEEKSGDGCCNQDVVDVLSSLINTRFDCLEKIINANTLKIEGLKKSVDFAYEEIQDVKKRVDVIENNTEMAPLFSSYKSVLLNPNATSDTGT